MQSATALGARTIIKPEAELLTEQKAGPAIEPESGLGTETETGPATKPGAKLAETKEFSVSIASITIINVNSS